LLSGNLPAALQEELQPALHSLMERCQPQGLWLFGSWARGTATRRSDVDLLVLGLEDLSVLQAYDRVLEALQSCSLPVQPVVVRSATLLRHGDSPFWLDVKREAIPLLECCRFP
jgi:predicted nucleotidyltransferase